MIALVGLFLVITGGLLTAVRLVSHRPACIAFISEETTHRRAAYRTCAGGRVTQRLSTPRVDTWDPAVSPDGKWLAFVSGDNSSQGIFRVRAAGDDPRLVSRSDTAGSLSWSPNSQWLAFVSQSDLRRVQTNDGGSIELLTAQVPGSDLYGNENRSPAWSPDGQWIAFVSTCDANQEIYVMRADGSDAHGLTESAGSNLSPVWSPDGQWIAFVSTRDANQEIYVMRADGSDVRRVTDTLYGEWSPTWSPDGQWIAFASSPTFYLLQIYRVRVDGSDRQQLTDLPGQYWNPVWSPDGNWIALLSNRDSIYPQLYRMHPDGTGLQRLTNDFTRGVANPVWWPLPAQHWHGWIPLIVGGLCIAWPLARERRHVPASI
jgi:TolB protein